MRRVILPVALIAFSLLLGGCIDTGEARRPDEFIGVTATSVASVKQKTKPIRKMNSSRKHLPQSSSSTSLAPAPIVPPADLKIPILVYHHLRDTSSYPKETWSYKMSVSPAVFAKHMQWLADRGYTTITLDTLADIYNGVRQGPVKPVVVTFDDNQLSSYDVGVPILASHNQTAVFYLITNRLENEGSIGTAQIPDLIAKGMDVQSHTVSHDDLTTLSDADLKYQLEQSRTSLEAVTSLPVRHLAYPLTAQNQRVRDAAKAAGYVTATIMDPRAATMQDSLFKLPRIMMTDDTNLEKVLP